MADPSITPPNPDPRRPRRAAVRAAARERCFPAFFGLKPHCEACGLDYSFVDAGDGPAVFVILIAGFIVVGAALVVEMRYQPPFWVHAVLWLPLILLTTLAPLARHEGRADRAAVSPQGRRRPARAPGRAVTSGKPPRQGLLVPSVAAALRLRGADRARHLAGRAQGLEGGADRDRDRALCGAAGPRCRRPPNGRGSIRRATNSAASLSRPSSSTTRRRWSSPPARACVATRPARATGCSRRRACPAAS